MSINSLHRLFARTFRPKRMRAFYETLGVTSETRIIDIGGTAFNWSLLRIKPRITVVNVVPPPSDLPDHIEWVQGDARALPFPDKHFDIAFSNSVIEHVGDWESQLVFADEVRRVADRHWVQTPNFWFPIEPHYLGPFTHWLSPAVQERFAVRYGSIWGLATRPTDARIRDLVAELRLLREDELRRLFPGSRIVRETVGGLVKSFTAIGGAEA